MALNRVLHSYPTYPNLADPASVEAMKGLNGSVLLPADIALPGEPVIELIQGGQHTFAVPDGITGYGAGSMAGDISQRWVFWRSHGRPYPAAILFAHGGVQLWPVERGEADDSVTRSGLLSAMHDSIRLLREKSDTSYRLWYGGKIHAAGLLGQSAVMTADIDAASA